MAVEAASFNTWMDSISEGLISAKELRTIPSTTTKAPLSFPVMVAPPRSTILGSLPGWPLMFTTRKPETVPCKDCPALAIAAFSSTALSNLEIEVVKVALFCEPP